MRNTSHNGVKRSAAVTWTRCAAAVIMSMFVGLGSALLVSGAAGQAANTQSITLDADGQSITVNANPLWTDTGIVLGENDLVTLSDAAGEWTWGGGGEFGPDGNYQPSLAWDEWIRNNYHGQLIGIVLPDGVDPNVVPRILPQDDPRLFTIGSATATRTGEAGRLWLGFNDDYSSEATWDNYGFVSVKTVVVPKSNDETLSEKAKTDPNEKNPPALCKAVCERADQLKKVDVAALRGSGHAAEADEIENIRAACYSCRCRQMIGHRVTMDRSDETPEALTFDVKKTDANTFAEELLKDAPNPPRVRPDPPACVNPALLSDVSPDHACAIGNKLGQASWTMTERDEKQEAQKRVYAKWIWRKKGAAGNDDYNDWGKIYYRDDGLTCNFDDIDGERDGTVLGQPQTSGWDYDADRHYPALDLTWVLEYWQKHRSGLTDQELVKEKIATDVDIDAWRKVFHVITGEQPSNCAGCHTAGPYLYTPFLSHLDYKGTPMPFRGVLVADEAHYVYPGYLGERLQVKTTKGAAKILDGGEPLKTPKDVDAFRRLFETRSFELTGQLMTTAVGRGASNQTSLTTAGCMKCHFIGKGENDMFYLKRLSINSTGTIHGATDDRPYPAEFTQRVDDVFLDHYDSLTVQQLQSVFPWAKWMPGTANVRATGGSTVKDLDTWQQKYVESKVLLELCRDTDHCTFREFTWGGRGLDKDFTPVP